MVNSDNWARLAPPALPSDLRSRHLPSMVLNGYPPDSAEYTRVTEDHVESWAVEVGGLVQTPLSVTLADLRAMAQHTQMTKHPRIPGLVRDRSVGWVPLSEILNTCHRTPGSHKPCWPVQQVSSHYPFRTALHCACEWRPS